MTVLNPTSTLSAAKLVPAARVHLSWGDKESRSKGRTPIGTACAGHFAMLLASIPIRVVAIVLEGRVPSELFTVGFCVCSVSVARGSTSGGVPASGVGAGVGVTHGLNRADADCSAAGCARCGCCTSSRHHCRKTRTVRKEGRRNLQVAQAVVANAAAGWSSQGVLTLREEMKILLRCC